MLTTQTRSIDWIGLLPKTLPAPPSSAKSASHPPPDVPLVCLCDPGPCASTRPRSKHSKPASDDFTFDRIATLHHNPAHRHDTHLNPSHSIKASFHRTKIAMAGGKGSAWRKRLDKATRSDTTQERLVARPEARRARTRAERVRSRTPRRRAFRCVCTFSASNLREQHPPRERVAYCIPCRRHALTRATPADAICHEPCPRRHHAHTKT